MVKAKRILFVISIFSSVFLHTTAAQAQGGGAQLSVGDGSGMPGDSGIVIPVRLTSDDGVGVTGLNFDLSFDAGRLNVQNVAIGGAASSASKTLSWSSPSSGRVRVIIFGLNQTAISNGTVANVTFGVNAGAASGATGLALSNATATDQSGSSVSLSLSSGTFTVIAPPSPPTATNSPVPPTSTATSTTAPKTLPSATPTETATLRPSPTRTATNPSAPSNTPQPSQTSAPATATRTATPTATRTSTTSSGLLSTSTPSGSATATRQASESATQTGDSTQATLLFTQGTATPTATSNPGLLAYVDPLEAAVIATSTALAAGADPHQDVNRPSIPDGEPGNPPAVLSQGVAGPASLADNPRLLTIIILVMGAAGLLLLTPLAVHVVRVRIGKRNYSGDKAESPYGSNSKDEMPLWRR